MQRLVELQNSTNRLPIPEVPTLGDFSSRDARLRAELRRSHERNSLKSSCFTQTIIDTVVFRLRRNFCKFRLTS